MANENTLPPSPAGGEPVAMAHITLEDDGPYIDLQVLNGTTLQPEHSPVALYTNPAKPVEDEASKLIAEAARLITPADGEAVFYIRVGGPHTHMSVKTSGEVDPDKALQNAIAALNGERASLSNCPVHTKPL